jgi:D-beta-D-heptose 7-phosphate kinase/D-beta-D-heptose 1-phosphate adenosyltransferase
MKKVLVIGDSCTDVFQYGKCRRICPEAPVPVLTPLESKENMGMAANVLINLQSLGVTTHIITNNVLPIKTRYIDEPSNQMILRVDSHDYVQALDWDVLYLTHFDDYDAVVISDYDKGFLDTEQIEFISTSHPVTFMDTKKRLGYWCNEIKYIKINDKESQENWAYLHEDYKNDIIVTLGNQGAVLNYKEKFPIEDEHPVRDLTGAGDTFLAGLVANYIDTKDIREAIKFANKCSSWAVSQKGVSVVSMKKLGL